MFLLSVQLHAKCSATVYWLLISGLVKKNNIKATYVIIKILNNIVLMVIKAQDKSLLITFKMHMPY